MFLVRKILFFYGKNASVVISSNVDGYVHVKIDSWENTFGINNNENVVEIPYLNASNEYYNIEFQFYPNNYSYLLSSIQRSK